MLFELLTGQPPFTGDSPVAVAYQHVREQPDPPSTHNPELDDALDAIVMKALAKRVDDRYQSAAEMQADVRRYLDGHPVTATVTPAAVAPLADAEPTSMFRPMPEPEEREEFLAALRPAAEDEERPEPTPDADLAALRDAAGPSDGWASEDAARPDERRDRLR